MSTEHESESELAKRKTMRAEQVRKDVTYRGKEEQQSEET
jgi:NADH/NAD ratio-sensing transcriptional regulator Rex